MATASILSLSYSLSYTFTMFTINNQRQRAWFHEACIRHNQGRISIYVPAITILLNRTVYNTGIYRQWFPYV